MQRGGTPTATDRVLATRYGVKAAELVEDGRFGQMAALHGTEMTSVPPREVEGVKQVDLALPEAREHLLRLGLLLWRRRRVAIWPGRRCRHSQARSGRPRLNSVRSPR